MPQGERHAKPSTAEDVAAPPRRPVPRLSVVACVSVLGRFQVGFGRFPSVSNPPFAALTFRHQRPYQPGTPSVPLRRTFFARTTPKPPQSPPYRPPLNA